MSEATKPKGVKSSVSKKTAGEKKTDPFNTQVSRPDSTGGSGLNDRMTSNKLSGIQTTDSEDEYQYQTTFNQR